MLHRFRAWVLGFLVWFIYRIISYTWRVELHEPESLKNKIAEKKSFILAHFHGDEIALIHLIRRYRVATMVSTSKDGEMMDVVLKLLGAKTSRGSSTRGGASALKGLITLCKKEGRTSTVAVDGPKGPIYQVKPGVFELSRLLNAEIFAAGVSCQSAWRFPKSWNQTYFPKPFAKIVIFWTSPLAVVNKEQDPRSSDLANQLQSNLFAAKQKAVDLFGTI